MDSEVVVFLRGRIEDFQSKMGTAGKEIDTLEKKGSGGFQKLGAVGGAALMGLGAAAIGFGEQAVKNYDDVEKAHAKLETALKNAGTTWDAQKKNVEKLQQSSEKLGFSYADVQSALSIAVTGTGNASESFKLLGVAQDLARFKGIDLNTAMLAVTKGAEGQIKPIRALGVDLPIAASGAKQVAAAQDKVTVAQQNLLKATAELTDGHTKHSKALQDVEKATNNLKGAQDKLWTTASGGQVIIDTLSNKLHGQAAASADTFGGKLKTLDAQWKDLSSKAGPAVIGMLTSMAKALTDTVNWFEKHKAAAYAAAVVIGGILVTSITAFIALKVQSVIEGMTLAIRALGLSSGTAAPEIAAAGAAEEGAGLAASSMLGPLGLAAAAIAGVAWAASNMSDKVKVNITDLKAMTTDALAKVIPKLDSAGITHKAFNTVLAASPEQAAKFIDALRQAGDKTTWYDEQLRNHIGTQAKADAANKAAADKVNAITAAVNGVPPAKNTTITADTSQASTALDNLVQLFSKLPTAAAAQSTFVFGGHARAAGGPVQMGQTYVVGEHGPEIFRPDAGGTIIPNHALGGGGGGGNRYSITVNVAPGGNPADTGRQVVEAIKQFELRAGKGWRAA